MGKKVPDWQTFIRCNGGDLIIRHLKSGLAEDLEIPWPEKLRSIKCEKVRFRADELQPLSHYGKTLDVVELKECEIEPGALSVLSQASSLRCLSIENCGISDSDLDWFKGTAKLDFLNLSENPNCTGAVIAQAVGSPLTSLFLQGIDFQDADISLMLSFPNLLTLNISDTRVTGAALLQLAVNRGLAIICDHDRESVSQFRSVQRQNWKKKLPFDEKLAEETMQLVKDFYAASQDRTQRRSGFVTQRYLDYCKAHGYNGVDPMSFGDPFIPPYQDYQVVDVEQITRKKCYVYSECDDRFLTQYRCLLLQTKDGWKIDNNERLMEGKWRFWRLD